MGTFSSFTAALGLPGLGEIQPYQLQLARVVLSIFTLLSVNAGLIYAAEHGVNPDIQNYFSALYFGLTTLTTVGFGDITPVTWQGKLVVCGSILAGVTIIPAQAALLVEALLDSQTEKELASQHQPSVDKISPPSTNDVLPSSAIDANTPCSSCGATFHWTSANYCWSCGGKL
jgi:voltage-gated potassium channel